MKVLEKSVFSQIEIISTNIERQKLNDLDFLRKQPSPGSFTISEAVTPFMKNEAKGKEKNKQMYIEVRFQRNTSQSHTKKLLHSVWNAMGKIWKQSMLPILVRILISQVVYQILLLVFWEMSWLVKAVLKKNPNVEIQQPPTSSDWNLSKNNQYLNIGSM